MNDPKARQVVLGHGRRLKNEKLKTKNTKRGAYRAALCVPQPCSRVNYIINYVIKS